MKASKIRNSIVLEQRERKREGEESFSEDSRLRTAVALLAKIFLGCHVAPELFLWYLPQQLHDLFIMELHWSTLFQPRIISSQGFFPASFSSLECNQQTTFSMREGKGCFQPQAYSRQGLVLFRPAQTTMPSRPLKKEIRTRKFLKRASIYKQVYANKADIVRIGEYAKVRQANHTGQKLTRWLEIGQKQTGPKESIRLLVLRIKIHAKVKTGFRLELVKNRNMRFHNVQLKTPNLKARSVWLAKQSVLFFFGRQSEMNTRSVFGICKALSLAIVVTRYNSKWKLKNWKLTETYGVHEWEVQRNRVRERRCCYEVDGLCYAPFTLRRPYKTWLSLRDHLRLI